VTSRGDELEALYAQRFPAEERAQKQAIRAVPCRDYFARFVDPGDTVVDIGAGYCEFINNIPAARKIAVDLNPDVRRHAAADVHVINSRCTAVASDFFDHPTPVTDRSLVEGLQLAGFVPRVVHPRFLPCTTKGPLPKVASLVRVCLRLPFLWWLFGKEALVIAQKPDPAGIA
jgi:hypothetical protein